ncbi:MAG: mechanosensitive ion channel [Acidibacter sp.]|jgi:small-conductance mechanosensitive channel|nr:mechanosensitive ion channel [Acidibacter sp.]
MNENTVASSKLLVELLSGDGLNEMIAILIVIAIAIISGRLAKAGLVRIGSDVMVRPWTGRLIETAVILTPYLVAALLIGLAENTARQFGMAYNVLVLTSQLVVALGVVRIAVYCLRLLLGDTSLVARWEARITLVLWLGLGFELLGWFNWLEETLDAIDLLPGKSVFSLWALLKGLIVITAFVVITSVIARAIERRVMLLETLAPSTRVGISKFTYFLLISLGILLGINAAGVDLTALTVLTGAIVFGLGFGIRDITANFVSGFVLLMDKSIKPGDVISFTQHTGTTSENFGWVQELRGRYVVVRDRDGVESLVPNQNLIINSVINWSYSDQRVRLRLPVMISYDDDPELALELLIKATSDHPRILRDPGPVSRLMSFENYGMKLEARFWIRDPMNGVNNVRSDVNRKIWQLFKEHGIKIPVAQQEVRVLEPGAIIARPASQPNDADPRG